MEEVERSRRPEARATQGAVAERNVGAIPGLGLGQGIDIDEALIARQGGELHVVTHAELAQ